jgi:ABC-type uncharacterized transport system substrate-binding protein
MVRAATKNMGMIWALRCMICAVSLALCSFAEAQQAARTYRVGFLSPAAVPDPSIPTTATSVPKLLRELGYVEGRNLQVERRFAAGKLDRLPQLARELVDLRMDVVVAVSPTAIKPAMDATKTIPIVMGFGKDRSEMDSSTALPSPAAISPAWSWRPRTYSPEKDWS